MLINKQYRKLYRSYMRKQYLHKRQISLWLDRKSDRHIRMMAALFFMGFILTLAYGYETLLTWSGISQIFAAFAVIFSFIPRTWLPFIYRVRKELKVILGVFALAPFFTGVFLMLNFHICIQKKTETYKITNYKIDYGEQMVLVSLENPMLNKHLEIRKFPLSKNKFEPDSASYEVCKGIFGIKSVHNSRLIPKK